MSEANLGLYRIKFNCVYYLNCVRLYFWGWPYPKLLWLDHWCPLSLTNQNAGVFHPQSHLWLTPISDSRDFCGALFFPTVATVLGATLYKNVPSQFKRTLLGGLTFAAIKGILKIYCKQHACLSMSEANLGLYWMKFNCVYYLILYYRYLFCVQNSKNSAVICS